MHKETPSPIDLPEPEMEEAGFGWTFAVIAITALFLLFTNAVSLREWVDDQPPSPVQAQAAELADQWLGLTEAMGIALPRDALHAQWKRAEAARFPAKTGDSEEAPQDLN